MGQNQAKEDFKDKKYILEVNEELDNDLREEIKPTQKTNPSLRKGTKLLKYSTKLKSKKTNSFNNSEDEESEKEENEIYLSYITELVDTIYSKNINMQLKNRPNRTVYESVFDIRNIINGEEDLNNDEYNIKSCQIMNEIIDPDISDINNNKKEEIKNNNEDNNDKKGNKEAEEEEDEKDDEEKSKSLENDFFKNWDYANDDIFINHNIEGEIDLNLDFYKNEKEKDKSKLRKNKKKLTEIEKSKRSKTNDNKSEKNLTLIKNNKSLMQLNDIITFKEKNDINEINNHINGNINNHINKIVNNNIKNNNNIDNDSIIDKEFKTKSQIKIDENNDDNKNLNFINKENINQNNIR